MSGSKLSSVVAIDTEHNAVYFYSKGQKGAPRLDCESYHAVPFGPALFAELDVILKRYKEKNPNVPLDHVALVLPNRVVCTDTITIPVVRKGMINQSLSLAINSLYKNSEELKFSSYQLSHNKVNLTYGIVGVRREYLDRVREIFSANGITVTGISFAANTAANALFTLNPKLKGGTFLFADLHENCCDLSFLQKGRVIGFYSLPFGHTILSDETVHEEHTLFDHSAAETLVRSAKQSAKTRQLGTASAVAKLAEWADGEGESTNVKTSPADVVSPQTGRKLPKFMQRPTPEDAEGKIAENFRIFVKWILELLHANASLLTFGAIDTVYVNLPTQYDFLFDKINEEQTESGVRFAPALSEHDRTEGEADHLCVLGALYLKQYNKFNNF